MGHTTLHKCFVAFVVCVLSASVVQGDKAEPAKKQDRHCGGKCLYVIFRQYSSGPSTYRELIRQLGQPGKEGYSLLQIRDCARQNGLQAECMKLSAADLRRIDKDTSVIAHLNVGHFVLLGDLGPDQLTIYDTSVGRNGCTSYQAFENEWSGNVLLVSQSEISLREPSLKTNRWTLGLVGIALLGCLLMVSRKIKGRGLFVVGALCLLVGCDSEVGGQAQRSRIGLKSERVDVGDVQQAVDFKLVKVPIRNLGHTPLVLQDGRVSCQCLDVRLPLVPIDPAEESAIECYLDCRTTGPKTATYSFSSSDKQNAQFALSWNVNAGVTVEPKYVGDIDLYNGETQSAVLSLTTVESDLRVEILPKKKSESLSITSKLVDGVCEVTFAALEDALADILTGEIRFINSKNDNAMASVPYIVRIHNAIEVTPRKLFFYDFNSEYRTQFVVKSSEALRGQEISIEWAQDQTSPAKIDVAEGGENLHIVDVYTDRNSANQTHLVIRLGTAKVVIPVVFIASEP